MPPSRPSTTASWNRSKAGANNSPAACEATGTRPEVLRPCPRRRHAKKVPRVRPCPAGSCPTVSSCVRCAVPPFLHVQRRAAAIVTRRYPLNRVHGDSLVSALGRTVCAVPHMAQSSAQTAVSRADTVAMTRPAPVGTSSDRGPRSRWRNSSVGIMAPSFSSPGRVSGAGTRPGRGTAPRLTQLAGAASRERRVCNEPHAVRHRTQSGWMHGHALVAHRGRLSRGRCRHGHRRAGPPGRGASHGRPRGRHGRVASAGRAAVPA